MNDELQRTYNQIMQAVCSEDVFGVIQGTTEEQLKMLKKNYRRLSKVVHPDRYKDSPDTLEMAGEAFGRLSKFYEKAQQKIKNGTYGKRLSESKEQEAGFIIQTRKRKYSIKSTLAQGDLCIVYGGESIGGDDFAGKNAVKVVEDLEDNSFMQNEFFH